MKTMNLRDFTPKDLQVIAKLHNTAYPDFKLDVEDFQHELDVEQVEFRPNYTVAVQDDMVVAFCEYRHEVGSYHPDRWSLEIVVEEGFRRQGIAKALYKDFLSKAAGLQEIQALAQEDCEAGILFLTKNGFSEDRRTYMSELNLETYQPVNLTPLEGIVVRPLSEIDTPELRQAYYKAFCDARLDIPRRHTPTPIPFDLFQSHHIDADPVAKENTFIALEGDTVVGFSTTFKAVDEGGLDQGLTGVIRSHRGRGLASLIKQTVLNAAKEAGYRRVNTDNDSQNGPMLAINRKLGFEPKPEVISFVKVF